MIRRDRIIRETWIGLACDADYPRLSGGHEAGTTSSRLTIAEALEVLE